MREISVRGVVAVGAIGGVLILLLFLAISGSRTYTVTAMFQNAGQVVPGNQVQIGGLRIGSVKSVGLSDDGQAQIQLELNREYAPLHQNTMAAIRVPGLAGIAARYVTLTPGPDNGPVIPDGGILPAEDTQGPVEVDALFSALDPRTLASLQKVIQGSSEAFKDRGQDALRAIEQLNPALTQSAATLNQVVRDQEAVKQLLSQTSGIVRTLAARRTELEQGTSATAAATGAIARQRSALADTIALAPPALRQANTTLSNVRGLLNEARPAIAEARPAARGASDLIPRLRPLVNRVRSQSGRIRQLAGEDVPELLDELPGLAEAGVPVLGNLSKALDDLAPVVSELRPYIPDVIGGLGGGGGHSSGYYDASGEYSRVEFVAGESTLTGILGGLTSVFEKPALRRCPGGAETYPPADHSAPFMDGGKAACDPSLGIAQP